MSGSKFYKDQVGCNLSSVAVIIFSGSKPLVMYF